MVFEAHILGDRSIFIIIIVVFFVCCCVCLPTSSIGPYLFITALSRLTSSKTSIIESLMIYIVLLLVRLDAAYPLSSDDQIKWDG